MTDHAVAQECQASAGRKQVTQWEYARLEYRSTGSLGTGKYLDWSAIFHHPGGLSRWGTDEQFDDLPHLNRAGDDGWQVYDRTALVIGQS